MAKKLMSWKTKGMNQDLSVSAFNPEFAFENMNLRLSTNEGNTLLSWVNEKGTKQIIDDKNAVISLIGTAIGTAVLNRNLIVFTTHSVKQIVDGKETLVKVADYIYKLTYIDEDKEQMSCETLYKKDLKLDAKHPLETLVSYESETVQKVYWVDGINQPRVINIKGNYKIPGTDPIQYKPDFVFDFVPTLQLKEDVVVTKQLGTGGMFAPGVIQYAFTYYNKYGQESNIFYTTPLYYISYGDRGASPEDKVDNTFDITVYNVDKNYDYLRIYSIQRTSINGTPIVKRIQDINLEDANYSGIATQMTWVNTEIMPTLYTNGRIVSDISQECEFTETQNVEGYTNISCYGFIKRSNIGFLANTDKYTVSYGSNAEDSSTIWITSRTINYGGKNVYVIFETPTPTYTDLRETVTVKQSGKGENFVSYLDTGLSGDTVDPTVLLYLGGESINAETLEQKDDTLFLGNITINRESLNDYKEELQSDNNYSIEETTRTITPDIIEGEIYRYGNQLTSKEEKIYPNSGIFTTCSTPCGGFKFGNAYRCGVQFQYKTGKWSEPIFLKDVTIGSNHSELSGNSIVLPILEGQISNGNLISKIYDAGYRRARGVVVYPNMHDRNVVCQGVANPTLYTNTHRTKDKDIFAQSSWFFRPKREDIEKINTVGAVFPTGVKMDFLTYTKRGIDDNSHYEPTDDKDDAIRTVEVQGTFTSDNQFRIDHKEMITLHSPELEFNDQAQVFDFDGVRYRETGKAVFAGTMSDISIQTETPVIGSAASGFTHKAFSMPTNHGIVSGLFYEDWIVDDMGDGESFDHFEKYNTEKQNSPVKWMVYLWNKDGSLNNDVNRPADKGTQTAVLKKKVISNLRFTNTNWANSITKDFDSLKTFDYNPQLFLSDNPTILKFGDAIYQGNIDTLLVPDDSDGMYFAFGNSTDSNLVSAGVSTPFTSDKWWKVFSKTPGAITDGYGVYRYNDANHQGLWSQYDSDYTVGKYYVDLVSKKEAVRMKYKSTAHLVLREKDEAQTKFSDDLWNTESTLPILEIVQKPAKYFGGTSSDALHENIWIPCGDPVSFSTDSSNIVFKYEWGDTYYQRYDCLKTYAYTKEDKNQVVEIGSFMLETYVNIDGRYDRNRGQKSNLNMSPQNFNLINPAYSQINNFFTYRIMDDSYYENTQFPNQITWSKTKQSGADVDQWTNVTLASVLELDGDKGKLNKLIRLNDQLLAFQDTGISQILYNDNVQISSTDGVPIEIANSGKVQGKRYLSNTIGCSNKWSMATTPNGIYFMDSHDKGIYMFNGQLNNISNTGGFNTWCKKNIPLTKDGWKPDFSDKESVAYYDKLNQDVLFINKDKALAWSEKLQAFTSFYDYGGTPFFCNLDDTGIWIKNGESGAELWKHQAGDYYCKFFGKNKPYWMTLVGNPEPQTDKIFTNLEFRACVDGDGTTKSVGEEITMDKFYLPFDYLETWNEYQHGYTALDNKTGHNMFIHGGDSSALIRKFRIWRNDIPRNNCLLDDEHAAYDIEHQDAKLPYKFDFAINISRHVRKPVDRMRNPWLYLTLMKNAAEEGKSLPKAEIHDLIMTYFN